jgi:N-carbamoylputrescine amidase
LVAARAAALSAPGERDMTSGEKPTDGKLRVACLQMEPRIGEKEANLQRSLAMIHEAAAAGADLVVLPELCNSGYVFESREEAYALSEPVDDGPTFSAWQEAAAQYDLLIAAGVAERSGDSLYNSAVLIGSTGLIGHYRKNHLWAEENLFFARGDLGIPVFDTPRGRFALAICYDVWFPEIFRLAALAGADLLCVPTNWVPMPGQRDDLPVMANILTMAGAHANGIFVAAADRVGIERGQPFLGRSLIVNPQGWPIAGPASADREEMLVADIDLTRADHGRSLNKFNHVLRDRRCDLYGLDPLPAAKALRPLMGSADAGRE